MAESTKARRTRTGQRTRSAVTSDRPVWESARGRVIWLTLALLFLALVALTFWLFVRTFSEGDAGGAQEGNDVLMQPSDEDGVLKSFVQLAETDGSSETHLGAETVIDHANTDTIGEGTQPSDGEQNIVYYRHKNDRMEIALSFDDGPHPRLTPEILDILKTYDIKATFFMVGENVSYYPEAAAAVIAAGHEVGNHTFSHKRMKGLSEAEIRREILKCEEAIASVEDGRPRLLRPPEGSMNTSLRHLAQQMDYRVILWDLDTRDWAHTPAATICSQILDNVEAGDIILMHDFIGHNSPTPQALRMVIPELLRRGYHFVTVSQLIEE